MQKLPYLGKWLCMRTAKACGKEEDALIKLGNRLVDQLLGYFAEQQTHHSKPQQCQLKAAARKHVDHILGLMATLDLQKKIHEDLERQGSAFQDPIDSVSCALLADWQERVEKSEAKLGHLGERV